MSSGSRVARQEADRADDRLDLVVRLLELDQRDDRVGLHGPADVDAVGARKVGEAGHGVGDAQLRGPREHEAHRAFLVVVGHQDDGPPEVRVDERRRRDDQLARRATPSPGGSHSPRAERGDTGERDRDPGDLHAREPLVQHGVGEQHRRHRVERAEHRDEREQALACSRARRARSRRRRRGRPPRRARASAGSIRSGARARGREREQDRERADARADERRERARPRGCRARGSR